jgi:hypothetical protein
MKKIFMVSSLLLFSTAALALTDFSAYCPAVSQLHMVNTAGIFSYSGTNNAGITLNADLNNVQATFNTASAPLPQAIDANLTTYIQATHTLRCDYTMTNNVSFIFDYALFDQGDYTKCPDHTLVPTGQPCPSTVVASTS